MGEKIAMGVNHGRLPDLYLHMMFRMEPNFYTSVLVDTWNFYVV
jgi:hypothetical protein